MLFDRPIKMIAGTPVDASVKRNKTPLTTRLRFTRLAACLLVGSLLVCLLAPEVVQETEAKKLKLKEKKAIKSLVKGLILKNLSTRKNFLPLPVPIPVPIEINDPPVYLKGKPKYVNIYKPAPTQAPAPPPAPIVKPTTYLHMPVYSPTYEYMMDPSGMYGSMYLPGSMTSGGSAAGYGASGAVAESLYGDMSLNSKTSLTGAGQPDSSFTDYDDEFGNYYVRKSSSPLSAVSSAAGSSSGGRSLHHHPAAAAAAAATTTTGGLIDFSSLGDGYNGMMMARSSERSDREHQRRSGQTDAYEKRNDHSSANQVAHNDLGVSGDSSVMPIESEESLDHENNEGHSRVKRQISYSSNYEGPCEGFPLEINIKSRLKLDSLFPIHGRSQFKKCLKKTPILPPVEDDHYPQQPPY